MPFTQPVFPDVDPEEYARLPMRERMEILTKFWAANGYGSPYMLHMIYIAKFLFLSSLLGLLIVTSTSPGVGGFLHVSSWWNEPIIYQKLILWVALLEMIGLGGAWGPLTGHFKPFYGGARYFMRPGLLRMAPWPDKVPFTGGTRRSVFDAVIYVLYLASLAVAIAMPGVKDYPHPVGNGGVVNHYLMIAPIILLIILGLRDKVAFLCGRGEQYLPAMVFFLILDPTDMIIAGKLLIVVVWCGAAFSKIGKHFESVIPPMVSNTPWTPRAMKLSNYRSYPNDLKPSRLAWFMAHVMGTILEFVIPVILLLSTNWTVTIVSIVIIVAFHIFITSTFPLAVPLEWNILFGFISVALFAGHPNEDGFGIFDFSQPWMLPVFLVALLIFPAIGNFRPDLISFLPSLRQYAGNWATALWTFTPGAEEKLKRAGLPSSVGLHSEQIRASGAPEEYIKIMVEMFVGWRSLHTQGRGLMSALRDYLGDDLDYREVWEGETGANLLLGWNFGDGHLHNLRFLETLRECCGFEPGEFVVAWAESQPLHKPTQEWFVFDGNLGVVERGTWNVADCVAAQPWLPDGPIPLNVTWRADRSAV